MNNPIKEFSIENTWDNDYDQTRYAYLSQVLILQKRQQEIMAQRERERKEIEKQFPQTKEEFENKAKDLQIRVARFLAAEKPQKEKLLAEFDWAWRQTEPLEKIFKTDVSNTLAVFLALCPHGPGFCRGSLRLKYAVCCSVLCKQRGIREGSDDSHPHPNTTLPQPGFCCISPSNHSK